MDEACTASVQRSSHRGAFVSTTTQCSLLPRLPLSLLLTIDINAVLCLAKPFQQCLLPPFATLPLLYLGISLPCSSCLAAAVRQLCLTLLYCLLLLLLFRMLMSLLLLLLLHFVGFCGLAKKKKKRKPTTTNNKNNTSRKKLIPRGH